MRSVLLLVALCGCDAVFGLDDAALPECFVDADQFKGTTPQILREVEVFSFSAKRDRAIAAIGGITVETESDGANPKPIDITPTYPMVAVAVEPNHDYFMFTASIEPPTLFMAFQENGKWKFDPRVPKGTVAGTPSDTMSGKPVRVVVRLFQNQQLFQEYERDDDGNWVPFGGRFELDAYAGANMTQDGLSIVFDGFDEDDMPGVYVAQRGAISNSFGEPNRVLEGVHQQPQLFGTCNTLYTVDEVEQARRLVRYTR